MFKLSLLSVAVSSLPYLVFFKGQPPFYMASGLILLTVALVGTWKGLLPSRRHLPLLLYLSYLPLAYFLSGSSQGVFALKTAGYFLGAYTSVVIMGRVLGEERGLKILANFLSFFSAAGLFFLALDLFGMRNFAVMSGMKIPYLGIHPIRSLVFGPNYFSILALMGFALSLYLFNSGERIYLLHTSLNLLGIVLSFSRAGYLALGVFLAVYLINRRGTRALLFILPGAMALFLLPRFLQISKGMTGREAIWPLAWELIKDFPVSGWGMGVEKIFAATGIKWGSAHNTFLDVGLMFGLVGLILYAVMFLYTLALVFREKSWKRELLLPLLPSLLVLSFFTTFVVGGFSLGSQLAGIFLGMGMKE